MPRIEHIAEGITLYLGDCREIAPAVFPVDAVLTDPPYGVDGQQNTRTAQRRGGRKNGYGQFTDSVEYVRRTAVPVIEMCIGRGARVVMTPGNRCVTLYPVPDSFGAIYQPASVGLQPWGRADAQPILYYGKSPYGGNELPGKRCSFTLTEAPEPNGHPCPKPIKFWTALLASVTKEGETVLDPFMGSGTTGVAAIQTGRRFVGIEIDPTYFDIACRRIAGATRQADMFIAKPKAKQLGLLDVQ